MRALRPSLPILHVVHGSDADGDTPPDVLTLRQPFSAKELLAAVDSLLP